MELLDRDRASPITGPPLPSPLPLLAPPPAKVFDSTLFHRFVRSKLVLVAFDNLVGQPFPGPYDLVSKARIALSRFIIGDSRYTGGTLLVGVTIKIARSARNSFEDLRGNVWAESGPEIWSIEIVDTLSIFVPPIFFHSSKISSKLAIYRF